jgi:NADH-quinone oxidoreductase subunit H
LFKLKKKEIRKKMRSYLG